MLRDLRQAHTSIRQDSRFAIQAAGKSLKRASPNPESRILRFPERSNTPMVILHYEISGNKQPPSPHGIIDSMSHGIIEPLKGSLKLGVYHHKSAVSERGRGRFFNESIAELIQ
jgi:hypothetical protein